MNQLTNFIFFECISFVLLVLMMLDDELFVSFLEMVSAMQAAAALLAAIVEALV